MSDGPGTGLLVFLTLGFGAVSAAFVVIARLWRRRRREGVVPPPMRGIDFNWLPHYPEIGMLVGWFGFVATGVAAAGLVGRLIGLW